MTTSALPDWSTGRVVATTPVARDVQRITIERPARGRAAPGSHLDVRVPSGDATDVRSYSVVESDDDGSLLTISVLRVPQSRGGSVFMHSLAPGDELQVTQPLQNFPLRVGAPRYVLLAGGIGITAVAAMARVLRGVGADYTLVYVGRSRERMAYVDELAALHGDRLVVHVDAEQTPLDVAELVRSIGVIRWAGHRALHVRPDPADGRRTPGVGGGLAAAGQPALRDLRQQRLVPARGVRGQRPAPPGVETTVRTDETVLEALTRAGVDLMYDCRKGECGLCLLDVDGVDGVLDHRDVFLSEQQKAMDGRSRPACRGSPPGPGPVGHPRSR